MKLTCVLHRPYGSCPRAPTSARIDRLEHLFDVGQFEFLEALPHHLALGATELGFLIKEFRRAHISKVFHYRTEFNFGITSFSRERMAGFAQRAEEAGEEGEKSTRGGFTRRHGELGEEILPAANLRASVSLCETFAFPASLAPFAFIRGASLPAANFGPLLPPLPSSVRNCISSVAFRRTSVNISRHVG